MNKNTAAAPLKAASTALNFDTVPVGTPLDWPIVDNDGTLLFDAGAILVDVEQRKFLCDNFKPRRGDVSEPAEATNAADVGKPDPSDRVTVKDMHLTIGAQISVRPQSGGGGLRRPCRIIGLAPNGALFTTAPLFDGRVMSLSVGENVEIVAIASRAVFRFVCTVESVCPLPFNYVVLSKPSVIQSLRARKSIRVHSHFPVRYGIGETGNTYEGIGLAKGLSALGMSLAASWVLGQVGDRLRVSYSLHSTDIDTHIETAAIIRNIQKGSAGEPALYGIELDRLDMEQKMAMKMFIFDLLMQE